MTQTNRNSNEVFASAMRIRCYKRTLAEIKKREAQHSVALSKQAEELRKEFISVPRGLPLKKVDVKTIPFVMPVSHPEEPKPIVRPWAEVLEDLRLVQRRRELNIRARWYARKQRRSERKSIEVRRQDLRALREIMAKLHWCAEHIDEVKYNGVSVSEIDARERSFSSDKIRVQTENPQDLSWEDHNLPASKVKEALAMPEPRAVEPVNTCWTGGHLPAREKKRLPSFGKFNRKNYHEVIKGLHIRPNNQVVEVEPFEVYYSPRREAHILPLNLEERMKLVDPTVKASKKYLLKERYMLAKCKKYLSLETVAYKWKEEPIQRTLLDMVNGVPSGRRSYWEVDPFSLMRRYHPETEEEIRAMDIAWRVFREQEKKAFLAKRRWKYIKDSKLECIFRGMHWEFKGMVYRSDQTPRHVWREYFTLVNFLFGDNLSKAVTTEEDEVQFSKYLHLDEVTVSEGTYEHERFDNDPFSYDPYRGAAWYSRAISGKDDLDMDTMPELEDEGNEVMGFWLTTIIGQRFFREAFRFYTGKDKEETYLPVMVKGGEEELKKKTLRLFKKLSFTAKEIESFGTDVRYQETIRRWGRSVTPSAARQLLPVARGEYQMFKGFPVLGNIFKDIGSILAGKAVM